MTIKITDFKFNDFLNSNIERDDFKFKYLIHFLDLVYARNQVNPNSFVISENESWILAMYSEHQLFLYGNQWTEEQIEQTKRNLNLQSLKNFEVFGTFDLVYQLLDEQKIKNYQLIMDRVFYESQNIKKFANENIELASMEDIDELIEMFQLYYEEEYKGTRNKTKEYFQGGMHKYILTNSLYVVKIDNSIKAFCSITNPDIGIVFTYKDYRRRGFAEKLISHCSQILLNENGIVYTITDKNNDGSNAMCEKIGFKNIYEHTNMKINCG